VAPLPVCFLRVLCFHAFGNKVNTTSLSEEIEYRVKYLFTSNKSVYVTTQASDGNKRRFFVLFYVS